MTTYSKIFSVLSFLLAMQASADNSQPCGTPGAYITVGETEQQMLTDCGQPISRREYEVPAANQGVKVRWYYVPNALLGKPGDTPLQINQGARSAVQFIDGKVDVIFSNYQTFDNYNLCGSIPDARRQVKQGMTMEQVQEACGSPSFSETVDAGTPVPSTTATDYIYQFDPSVPAVKATVEDGVVTSVQ